ncbi:MAG: proline racemase family protein [candidate division KSB1 bacterium]|nr:proline racemase family protein [candidate division KSB1 bacterium]MDZ7366844.1 proline racemase family protein [candidate division KSB1 bacterium]MDZ7405149.1 proline racemase family protein [candidate division KSB1 bacterium]
MSLNWNPPRDWIKITAIEAHTAGEPLRVITGGLPPIPGQTILEKRRYAAEHLDHLRTALMWEPRGHADMYGCIVTEPVTPDGTLGVLFLHNEGFSTMCGHGVIGLAKVALDTGMLAVDGDHPVIRMDTPAGRVTAFARRENGRVVEVSFHNVPSFVYACEKVIHVDGVGWLQCDVAFGGAFYAFCRAEEIGIDLTPANFRQLIDVGMRIKLAVMTSLPIQHPFEKDLGFLYGTIIVGPPHDPKHHSRNVCIFADGEIDRSPTGTGVSARVALHYARGEIKINEPIMIESILGTCFTAEVVETTKFGPYDAVIPKVTGTAFIIGRNELLIDPDDPLRQGFILR